MTDPLPAAPEPGPPPRVIRFDPARAGARLDLFLAAELSLSRGQVRRLLERGAVRLDGRVLELADKGREVPASGALEVAAWRPAGDEVIPPARGAGPAVLAEGAGWLAIDKPAGMPVHPLREDEHDTVLGHVVARWPQVQGVGEGGLRSGVVHRLDVDTSGVLLVGTEASTWDRLRGAFARHAVCKTYRAIVRGRLDTAERGREGLRMEVPLVVARHRPAHVRVARPEEVRRGRARTMRQTVRTLDLLEDATLVEVRPETGFLHQIRASLADLGHPLLGDHRYADDDTAQRASRHMLHAARIEFDEIDVSSPDAADFADCLRVARG